MKPSVHIQSDQPKKLSKREDKKSVNHNWNSRLYFQLGLIVSLLITGVVLESTIGLTINYASNEKEFGIEEPPMITYVIEEPKVVEVPKPVKKVKPAPKKPVVTSVFTPVKNDANVVETPVAPTTVTEAPVSPPVETPSTPVVDNRKRNIMEVEFVPLFPGCENLGDHEARVACMSDKVKRFISRKFDVDKFHYLDSGAMVRIYVEFTIDKSGNVSEIIARAPDKKLEEEASRVISKLPEMTPGRQSNVPVDVQYLVPIVFRIQ